MKLILLMLISWWIGKHVSLRKMSGTCYPLGIRIEQWVFSWHIFIHCYKYAIQIYVNDWTGHDYRKTKPIELLPCWRKGTGGIYGTPDGDFEFKFNDFCWGTYRKERDESQNIS